MRVLFIQFINAVSTNLTNKEFISFFTKDEINFLNTLIKENVNLLNTIFDSIKQVEEDGKVNLHDLPHIINIIITIFRVFLLDNKIYNIPLFTIVKFITDTLITDKIITFADNVVVDEIKSVVRTTLQILNTDIKIKPPKSIHRFLHYFNLST